MKQKCRLQASLYGRIKLSQSYSNYVSPENLASFGIFHR